MKKSDVEKIIKELEEVSIAVSITGTSKKKLGQLVQLVKPVFDDLHGGRREIASVRNDGVRFIHNLSRSSVKSKQASKIIKSGIPILKRIISLLNKDIGIKRDVNFDNMKIIDNIGYSKKDIDGLLSILSESKKYLKKYKLDFLINGEMRVASPSFTSDSNSIFYSLFMELFYVKLQGNVKVSNTLEAFANKLWLAHFDNKDVKIWSLNDEQPWNSYSRFIGEFMDRVYRNKSNKALDIVWDKTVNKIINKERGRK